jgi:hypothetical protein
MQLALAGFGIYYYYHRHPFGPEFNLVLATGAVLNRLLAHLLRLVNRLQGGEDEWQDLRWPRIVQTILAWIVAVVMAGYIHYTVLAYRLILVSVPDYVTRQLRHVLHMGWLVWPISVVAWALWLTVALEAIRRIFLFVFGVNLDLEGRINPSGGFLSLQTSRGEESYAFTLTVWFITFSYSRE